MTAMNDDAPPRSETPGLFIPFILLAASVLLFLIWQVTNVQSQRSGLETARMQIVEAIRAREPQVEESIQINNRFEAFAIDLLELARTNENAQAIVKRHDIQRAAPRK